MNLAGFDLCQECAARHRTAFLLLFLSGVSLVAPANMKLATAAS